MKHKERKVLHALFAHPVSANISARSAGAVLKELGAEIEQRDGGRWRLQLNGHCVEVPEPSNALKPKHVKKIRDFITNCGIDPNRHYPL